MIFMAYKNLRKRFGTGALLVGLGASGVFLAGCGGSPSVTAAPAPPKTVKETCFSNLLPWAYAAASDNSYANGGGGYNDQVLAQMNSYTHSSEVGEIGGIAAIAQADAEIMSPRSAVLGMDNSLRTWCNNNSSMYVQIPAPSSN
jgi:hypothetical protein